MLITTTTYNAASKPTVVTAPDGTSTTTAYDQAGRPSTVKSSSGRLVRTTYDAASRPLMVTDETSGTLDSSITRNLGSVVRETRTYHPGGLLATLQDGKNNTFTYKYDGFGRLASIDYPGSTTAARDADLYGYDKAGSMVVFQRRDGSQIRWTYDALNRPETKTATGLPVISYDYGDSLQI